MCLPETLKLYITQVVVEPSVGDRKPEASLNRHVFIQAFSGNAKETTAVKARTVNGIYFYTQGM